MKKIIAVPVSFFLMLFFASSVQASGALTSGALKWQGWTSDLFTRASAQNKFVILDLEAVWCHWCHVMEEKTYGDPKVQALLKKKYITVRVDQDASLDLSARYGDWGWPATIIFAPDGTEIVKLSGYIPAPRMAFLLQAIIDDPSPGPSVLAKVSVTPSTNTYLSKAQRQHLRENYRAVYDQKHGGWGQVHKFIHTDSMELAFSDAEAGDRDAEKRARQTLDAALLLIDPVWGGVYQYSDQRDWKSPHFEKIMSYQADYMRHYAKAYTLWGKPQYLKAARAIDRYLKDFLTSPKGTFYTSQDADLNLHVDGHKFYALDAKARAKAGMPRIDKNIYTRENAWAIRGLLALYSATNDQKVLDRALKSAHWIVQNHRLKGGGFSHGKTDRGGPFLGDNLAMGQAGLDLYAATGDRRWLNIAHEAGFYIDQNFKHRSAGYITSKVSAASIGVFKDPVRQIEENMQLARFANLLYRYFGAKKHQLMSHHVMRYLTAENVTNQRRFLAGILLADREVAKEPVHITIVGAKSNPKSQILHIEGRKYAAQYKRLDWWDVKEGPLPNPDVQYPELDQPAAFACANQICSLPVFTPDQLAKAVKRMTRPKAPL